MLLELDGEGAEPLAGLGDHRDMAGIRRVLFFPDIAIVIAKLDGKPSRIDTARDGDERLEHLIPVVAAEAEARTGGNERADRSDTGRR